MKPAALALAALALLMPAALSAGEGNDRRTTTAETDFDASYPVSFRSETGGRFEPDRLVLLTREGAWSAALPGRARRVRQGDHLDASGLPLIGRYFRQRLAPQDAEQDGLPLGTLSRAGDTLVLDARAHAVPLTALGLVLTSELPRLGTLAFEMGVPDYRPLAAPQAVGPRVGGGYLVNGRLVLAADGARPPIR